MDSMGELSCKAHLTMTSIRSYSTQNRLDVGPCSMQGGESVWVLVPVLVGVANDQALVSTPGRAGTGVIVVFVAFIVVVTFVVVVVVVVVRQRDK
jgi:hypothetical protein